MIPLIYPGFRYHQTTSTFKTLCNFKSSTFVSRNNFTTHKTELTTSRFVTRVRSFVYIYTIRIGLPQEPNRANAFFCLATRNYRQHFADYSCLQQESKKSDSFVDQDNSLCSISMKKLPSILELFCQNISHPEQAPTALFWYIRHIPSGNTSLGPLDHLEQSKGSLVHSSWTELEQVPDYFWCVLNHRFNRLLR